MSTKPKKSDFTKPFDDNIVRLDKMGYIAALEKYCAELENEKKETEKIHQLEKAEQQMFGFTHAQRGYSIEDLVDGMGLKKSEWETIKKDYPTSLSKGSRNDIDKYFSDH